MKRFDLIDTLRGLSIISMIAFHACWLINFFNLGISDETLFGRGFFAWERSICISFIMIAGYSFSLGRRHLRSGLILTVLGAVITLLTVLFLPGIHIVFGILTFMGAVTLLMIPFDKLYVSSCKKNVRTERSGIIHIISFALSLLLFLFSYDINRGTVGLPFCPDIQLPVWLFRGYIATFIGFMEPGFDSVDYFSLIPWCFIFMCGYFLHKIIKDSTAEEKIMTRGIPMIRSIGRHSLLIYIIHPIVLFMLIGGVSLILK